MRKNSQLEHIPSFLVDTQYGIAQEFWVKNERMDTLKKLMYRSIMKRAIVRDDRFLKKFSSLTQIDPHLLMLTFSRKIAIANYPKFNQKLQRHFSK